MGNSHAPTPDYWSVDPATFDLWVAELGYAAAGKLMAACAGYFLHGDEPDQIRLTKSARNMFEAERGKLDRRRAMALRASKGSGGKAAVDAPDQPATNVEKSESSGKVSEKSRKSRGKTCEKSEAGQPAKQASTSGDASKRLAPIITLNRNQNPQPPVTVQVWEEHPSPIRVQVRGSGAVSQEEFAAMLREGMGYSSPTAYGMWRTDGHRPAAGG